MIHNICKNASKSMTTHRIAFILRSKANPNNVFIAGENIDLSVKSILDLNIREIIDPHLNDLSFNDPELVDFQIATHEYARKTD
jgi:hypothetical protein